MCMVRGNDRPRESGIIARVDRQRQESKIFHTPADAERETTGLPRPASPASAGAPYKHPGYSRDYRFDSVSYGGNTFSDFQFVSSARILRNDFDDKTGADATGFVRQPYYIIKPVVAPTLH